MGIPELWQLFDQAEIGETISTAAFAAAHFERERRPLRIAVDVSIWKFKCYLEPQRVADIRRNVPAANPNEKNILYKILKLLKLNIQLIFVADGRNRPSEKFGGQSPWYKYRSQDDSLLKQTVTSLGVIWHEAPGEAEAECSAMQSRGVVDAVWTEDSDAFMFGATNLIRFCHLKKHKVKKAGNNAGGLNEPDETKREVDIDNITVYRADRIQERFPGLTRDGLVLFAVLKGGDYSKNGKGLMNCGVVLALEISTAKEGFGKDLCDASVADYPAWSNRLREYLTKTNSRVEVPDKFPDPRIVSLYNRPLISSERIINDIGKFWDVSFDEMELQKMIAPKFNFWVAEYIKHIIPILLIRSLASTQPGQEASNNCYRLNMITKKKAPALQKNVEVLLSAVTSMDVQAWRSEFTNDRGGKVAPVTEMVKCENLLSCIIEHGTKKALPPATSSSRCDESTDAPGMISKGKRRAGSPIISSKNNSSTQPQQQQPAKRVKNTPGKLSGSRPFTEGLIKSTPPHIEISRQPRSISSNGNEVPPQILSKRDINQTKPNEPRNAQPPKSSTQGNAKTSSGLTVDLTLDDSSGEEENAPITSTCAHAPTSINPQMNAITEARLRLLGSGMIEPSSTSAVQQSSHSASPIANRNSQCTPLAKKPLPKGIKDEDFDGFFSDSSVE